MKELKKCINILEGMRKKWKSVGKARWFVNLVGQKEHYEEIHILMNLLIIRYTEAMKVGECD